MSECDVLIGTVGLAIFLFRFLFLFQIGSSFGDNSVIGQTSLLKGFLSPICYCCFSYLGFFWGFSFCIVLLDWR